MTDRSERLKELDRKYQEILNAPLERVKPKAPAARPKPRVRTKVVEVSRRDPNYTVENQGLVAVEVLEDPHQRRPRVLNEQAYVSTLNGWSTGPVEGFMPS